MGRERRRLAMVAIVVIVAMVVGVVIGALGMAGYEEPVDRAYRARMKEAIQSKMRLGASAAPTIEEMNFFLLLEIYRQGGGDIWGKEI